jgi:hypothetical protein
MSKLKNESRLIVPPPSPTIHTHASSPAPPHPTKLSEQDISEDSIKRLTARLVAYCEAPDMWRPNVEIIKDADSGDVRFIVKAQGVAGGKLIGIYEIDTAADYLLGYFGRVFKPKAACESMAEDYALGAMLLLLKHLPGLLNDTLFLLMSVCLLQTAEVAQSPASNSLRLSDKGRKRVEKLLAGYLKILKKRLLAGRGRRTGTPNSGVKFTYKKFKASVVSISRSAGENTTIAGEPKQAAVARSMGFWGADQLREAMRNDFLKENGQLRTHGHTSCSWKAVVRKILNPASSL